MNRVILTEALRTPFGRFGGKLARYSAVELGTLATQALLARADVDPGDVDESIFGTAMLAASTSVAARQINVRSGIPASTPSLTVDRACCSSMTCIGLGLAKIRADEAAVILAGGIESASQTPFLMRGVRWGRRLGNFEVEDPMQLRNPINGQPITVVTGEAALAFGVDRAQQDDWSFDSHRKYFEAFDAGRYADEIIPVAIDAERDEMLAVDESARRSVSREKLAQLPTAYGSPTVTAGNAPGLNDGAATVLLMSAAEAKRRNATGLGEILSYAQVCGEPDSSVFMPGRAIQLALRKAGLGLADLKRIEINEAFAAMPLVSTLELAQGDTALLAQLRSITNVNGGSVALGHPTGASGARVVMAVARELRRMGGGIGAAAICGGYGQADAVIVKV
jgi:acetyl-CoA C-acetyltransferase